MQPIPRQAYEDPHFQMRREELRKFILQPLGEHRFYAPDPSNGVETPCVHRYNAAYRTRLQYYHLCLAAGQEVQEANRYFESHEDLVSHWWNHPRNEPDWKMGPLVRIYFECRSELSDVARLRIENLMREFRGYIAFGGTENHIINRVVIALLCDAALGIADAKTRLAAEVYERWIWLRGHRGYMEYNSPTYHTHSIQPLLLMHDFAPNSKWKDLATRALDQAMSMIAIQSLEGSRGGPWHRATNPNELKDSRSDVAYVASHVFFGNCPRPPTIGTAAWATTKYRVPEIIYRIAMDRPTLGTYEIRQRVDTVDPVLDAYYYIGPNFLLGSFQNAKPFDCRYYGSTNVSNLHPWELSFADPLKVLGVWRDLTTVSENNHANTALMQYRGVLFFQGSWLDYNGNLGQPAVEIGDQRKISYYNIPTGESCVYAAIIEYVDQAAGILEVCLPEEVNDWEHFRAKLRSATGSCDMNHRSISHTNINGDVIAFQNGQATVNGRPFSLESYPLCESPSVNSDWDSGLIQIRHHDKDLLLDFRDPSVRSGRGLSATYYSDPDFQKVAFERVDQTIDYSWRKKRPVVDSTNGFSVRWHGTFLASYTGCHQFTIVTVGKAGLWIDGQSVITADSDPDSRGTATIERTGAIGLVAGQQHEMKVEYSQTGDEAVIVIRMSTPFLPHQTLGLLCELAPSPTKLE
jgi:hypothetical protein